jgi:hypothetical protein
MAGILIRWQACIIVSAGNLKIHVITDCLIRPLVTR